jgi:hypothetical protein
MNEPRIICPHCRHQLRVPPELLGTQVECPECFTTFRAPPGEVDEDDRPLVRRAGSSASGKAALTWLKMPAGFLIAIALLGLLINGLALFDVVSDPEGAEKRTNDGMAMIAKAFNAPNPPHQPASRILLQSAIFVALGLLTFFGALAMIAGRAYGLAIIGAVTALLNMSACCCLPAAPFSLWALILLSRDDVRAQFS